MTAILAECTSVLDTVAADLPADPVNGLTIEQSARRAAIMMWRDDATLGALALIRSASVRALRSLDDRLDEIAIVDAMFGAEAAAQTLVRPLMRAATGAAADAWFKEHALALRRIDERLEAQALHFAAMSRRPTLPRDDLTQATERDFPAWLRNSVSTMGTTFAHVRHDLAGRVVSPMIRRRVAHMSAHVARGVGERSGAYDRVRAAARSELLCRWQGPAAADVTPRSFLDQLVQIVDRTSSKSLAVLAC